MQRYGRISHTRTATLMRSKGRPESLLRSIVQLLHLCGEATQRRKGINSAGPPSYKLPVPNDHYQYSRYHKISQIDFNRTYACTCGMQCGDRGGPKLTLKRSTHCIPCQTALAKCPIAHYRECRPGKCITSLMRLSGIHASRLKQKRLIPFSPKMEVFGAAIPAARLAD